MGIPTGEDPDFAPGSSVGATARTGEGRIRVRGKRFSRGDEQIILRGVTYGPFCPDREGRPFPSRRRARDDLAAVQAMGANSIRLYHVPPRWLLDLLEERGMTAFIGIPWASHVCFLQSRRGEATPAAKSGARRKPAASAPCVLAYGIGNEIPTDIIRWHGSRRVTRFLAELRDVAKQADPEGLVTYASYPPTEYLDLSFLDFATFNVYLHDPSAFRDYAFPAPEPRRRPARSSWASSGWIRCGTARPNRPGCWRATCARPS